MINIIKQSLDFESRQILIDVKRKVFEQINVARRNNGLGPVLYDKLAAQVGEAHCREMLEHKYLSHWNLRGLKPYHRYSDAGGRDSIYENCSSFDSNFNAFNSVEDIIKASLESHALMLAEEPPNDGHRKNILNPFHTHVGIGIAVNSGSMRMTQEFIQRYVLINMSSVSGFTDKVEMAGRILNADYKFRSIAVFYEPPPDPLTVDELNNTSSYGFPKDVYYEHPVLPPNRFYQDGSRGSIMLQENRAVFTCKFGFRLNRRGIYTICVWLETKDGRSFMATNISVKVKN
jgi:uncharacterized protein YkwD